MDSGTVLLFLTTVFSAGKLWQKMNGIEKKIDTVDQEKHGERIAVLESKIGIHHDV